MEDYPDIEIMLDSSTEISSQPASASLYTSNLFVNILVCVSVYLAIVHLTVVEALLSNTAEINRFDTGFSSDIIDSNDNLKY